MLAACFIHKCKYSNEKNFFSWNMLSNMWNSFLIQLQKKAFKTLSVYYYIIWYTPALALLLLFYLYNIPCI